MAPSLRPILLVEDDPGHARLIVKNLRRAGVANPIDWIDNGQLAVDRLLQPGDLAQHSEPLPGLVLLDLNLPGLDGFQVLAQLRSAARTRELPVAVLTTTDQPGEIRRCFELGCNRFLRKPISDDQCCETIGGILQLLESVDANSLHASHPATDPIRAGHD